MQRLFRLFQPAPQALGLRVLLQQAFPFPPQALDLFLVLLVLLAREGGVAFRRLPGGEEVIAA